MKIKISEASIYINDLLILENVNFELNEGALIRIQGENGSGKTVFMNTILGLNKVKFGTSEIGYNRKEVCYIQDSPFFFDDETVLSVLKTYLRMYDVKMHEIYAALQSINFEIKIGDRRKLSDLSKGMRKKLLILPVFFKKNSFFVLDEVFTGLDFMSQNILICRINDMVKTNATVIIVEHNESIFSEIMRSSSKQWEVLTCVNGLVEKN